MFKDDKFVEDKLALSNSGAIVALQKLGYDFSGHEKEVLYILDRVRRDEWGDICEHYEH